MTTTVRNPRPKLYDDRYAPVVVSDFEIAYLDQYADPYNENRDETLYGAHGLCWVGEVSVRNLTDRDMQYNDFDMETFGLAMRDVMIDPDTVVLFGREYSPVVYIPMSAFGGHNATRVLYRLAKADEIDYVKVRGNEFLRLWWD